MASRHAAKKVTGYAVGAICFLSVIDMMGCTVGPDFVRPEPLPVKHYTQQAEPTTTIPADGQAQRFEEGAAVIAEWWRLFNSSKLDDVIKEAVANNQTLQAAQARLRQSQDNLRAGYGVFYPQVDVGFEAARLKASQVNISGTPGSSIFNLYTLTGTISYALDVFGGNRRVVESLQAQEDFQRYTVLGTYLALTGNVVNTVIAAVTYGAQIEATEQIISAEKEQIEIAEAQAEAGTVPYMNVLSIKAQMAATEATIPQLKQKLSQAKHLLAALVGHTPAEWAAPHVDLADLELPTDLPITLPSELVRQRPDILAAEAQLHSASAEIGVATAALFPSFTLNGTAGLNNTSISDLLKSSGSFWSLGANIAAPLFHGGTLVSQRQAAIDAYEESQANYRQTVLSAFTQVADTLRALEHDAETLHAQSQALSAAEEALMLTQANYQAGIANYLQVLIANGQYHQAKLGYLQALAQRFQDTVALFIALGGGWWNADEKVVGGSGILRRFALIASHGSDRRERWR
ncbi:MAG TPA: efflux transporter outer membrane subunit [Thermodesulfovibrionales bacterium]|nr:efflux transporter outer membrane subunit [Thermodesulfovibrionales bacterium]